MTDADAAKFLYRLATEGGCIVSSGVCSELEIADANMRGDFYVDADGLGYVRRMKAWLDRVHKRDGYMQPRLAPTKEDSDAKRD